LKAATTDAVRALKLRRGEDAIAIVRSTEVMIAAQAKPSSAVDFAVLVFSGSENR
jgi:hypothetical protein